MNTSYSKKSLALYFLFSSRFKASVEGKELVRIQERWRPLVAGLVGSSIVFSIIDILVNLIAKRTLIDWTYRGQHFMLFVFKVRN